jgi:aminoglycoside phosphotransferase (APT) family kinase protein
MPRVVNLRPLLESTFREGAQLPPTLDGLEFLQRHYSDVYRVFAGGGTYIAHVTLDGREYLRRVRDNLATLAALNDARIPRVIAWQEADDHGQDQWAVLVYPEIAGGELNPRTYTPAVWADLCELLLRVHALPAPTAPAFLVTPRIDDVQAFPGFAEELLGRLRDLRLRRERVERHLAAMAEYVRSGSASFSIPSRLIHGDLNRSNVVVGPSGAGIIDWSELGAGDYAYDLAMLKFAMDSVAPKASAELLRSQAIQYRRRFQDDTLEKRLRFFLALPGLVFAFKYASQTALFGPARAWRVRTCYLHSEAQWQAPLRLDGPKPGAPAVWTEHWALRIPQPLRGVFYLVAPKRVI